MPGYQYSSECHGSLTDPREPCHLKAIKKTHCRVIFCNIKVPSEIVCAICPQCDMYATPEITKKKQT